ncbi:MAG TPA: carboxypeptidase-like regulatory domain-containing protein [Acidobacteriaceae bacterium]
MRNFMRCSIALAIFLFASLAFTQNTNSGNIRGTVTDATGAVLPGVTVTVEDIDKGVTTTYVTDGSGLYDTGSIVPDHYTLTFTKDGFSTFVRGPITLRVQTLTVDGSLKVGATTQTVRVTTDVPLLQTETGAQSTTLPEKELQDLPQVGASWENFVILMPGTSGTPTGGLSNVNPGQTASVNGNAVFYNVLGDGITMSLPSNGNSYDYNFDTLGEVQVVTNAFSAQYENGGVIYNQISKGGSNQFHGDVFEYFQNNALNAAPYSFGYPAAVPTLHSNYFGGSVGGYVPGPLRKRLFFFFNYDYSQYYGGSSNGYETVPTAAMLDGDFTGITYNLPNGGGTAPLLIYDPTTQIVTTGPNGPVVSRQSFADEYGNGNKIPENLLDPVAQKIQAYYPKPNVPNPTVQNGITSNNVFYNIPSNSPSWSYFYRVDFDITPTNRLTATEYYTKGQSNELSNDCPINCTTATNSAITAQLTDVWTFSPDKTNEFRVGLSTQNNLYLPETIGQGYPTKIGLQFAKADLFPTVNVGSEWQLAPGTNAIQHQIMFEPSDVLTLIKGKHVLHMGGEFLNQQINSTFWGNVDAGQFTYAGVYTAHDQTTAAISGFPYADFLLGQTQAWTASNTPEFYPRTKTFQAFIQDDIKVLPNFTFNVGLRWEGWTGMTEAHNNMRSWDPNVINPGVDPFGNANTPGAMWYGTTQANGRTRVIAPSWDTFLPRFGFSWQAKSNTVVRGGLGLFGYNYNEGPNAYNELGSEFGQSGNETDQTNGVFPVVILSSDGNTNNQGPYGSSVNSLYLNAPTTPDALNGQSVNFAYYHEPISKIWQYNLEVQRELGPNTVVNVAYVGSHGYEQIFGIDLNQIPEDKLGPNDTTGATNARPYPNFQSIGGNKFVGISNYNSLQATIEKRLTSGLQFNFNYTWSKFLNDGDPCAWNCGTTTVQNMYVPSQNYGPADYDIRHMFKGRVIYQLPVGKGQRFLNNNSPLAQIVGGWQTAATIQWQTGNPFTVTTANDNSYSQSGTQYPNVVPDVSPWSGNVRTVGPNGNWFNEAAFSQPADGTFGDSSRNSLYGPHLSNINLSLAKNFPIWKTVLQIRADSTNVFNHPSFGLPNSQIGPGQQSTITSVTVGGRAVQLLGRLTF